MRIFLLTLFAAALITTPAFGADSLDYTQWSQLAIQDGGRRKPVDTFAKETLLRLTGKTTYAASNRKWQPNEFILSMLLDDSIQWQKEPLILIEYRPLAARLKLDLARKPFCFSFEELTNIPALNDLVREAHELRQQEKELNRMQKEAETVAGRLSLFSNLQSGRVFLIVPPPANPNARWL